LNGQITDVEIRTPESGWYTASTFTNYGMLRNTSRTYQLVSIGKSVLCVSLADKLNELKNLPERNKMDMNLTNKYKS